MQEQPKKAPIKIRLAHPLFFVNAAIWLAFGIASLLRLANQATVQITTMLAITLLMFANVGAMLVCGVGLGKRSLLVYLLSLAVLIVNIILSVTDEFGVFDFITLAIDLVLLGNLFLGRKDWFTESQ